MGCAFLLPKNKVQTASAAAPSYGTPILTEISARGLTGAQSAYPSGGVTYAIMGTSINATKSVSGNSITINENGTIINYNHVYIEFYVEVNVPAKTEYEIKYDFTLNLKNIGVNVSSCTGTPSNPGGNCTGASLALYRIHDLSSPYADQSSNGMAFYIDMPSAFSQYLGHIKSNENNNLCGNLNSSTCNETFIFDNSTSADKIYKVKYGLALGSYGQGRPIIQAHQFNSSLSVVSTLNNIKLKAPTAPTTTDTYTGNPLSFDMAYSSVYVEPTAVTGVDPDGNALATPITLADIDTTACKFKPTLAGTYEVTFGIKSTAVALGAVWDSGITPPIKLTFTVNRKAIPIPTNTPENYIYSGVAQSISYTHSYLSSLTVTPADAGVTFLQGSTDTDGTFEGVTDAGSYNISFALNNVNYEWDAADKLGDKSIVVKMKPKTLELDYKLNGSTDFSDIKTNSTGNITAAYKGTDGPVNSEVPKIKFSYEFNGVKKEITTDEIANLSKDITTLEGTGGIFSSGTYKLIAELPTSEAVNKNYVMGASKEKSFTVGAGAVDLSALKVQYTKTSTGSAKTDVPAGGLTYAYDSDTKTAEEYKFYLDFSALTYLTDDGYTYRYDGETATVSGFVKAGTAQVAATIKLANPSDTNHSLPATFATSGTPFDSYTNNNDGTATLVFKVVIDKAQTTLTGADIPLQYWFADDTAKKPYDRDNPPQCKDGIPVYVEWTGEKPHGVTNVVFDSTPAQEVLAGDYEIDATVTLDDNHKTASGGNTMKVKIAWKLAKQLIKLDWTDKQIDKPGLAPHYVKALNNLTDGQKQVIKYVYYLDVGGTCDTVALTQAQFEALCTNDRYTDPKWLWVEAVIDTTVTGHDKFELEADPVKNPVRFKLGRNMTMVEVTKSPEWDKLVYGGGLDKSTAFTFTDKSTNLAWNSIFYELHVYKNGEDLGLFDAFDFSTANAGDDYTVEVVMKPAAINSDGDDLYALDIGKSIPFTISPKGIELPTVDTITFNNTFINLGNYLKGSYESYKDIIVLGGTYDGVKNANTPYTATLTLMDGNYYWIYPDGATPSKSLVKFALTDDSYSVTGNATVATYTWKINPYVLGANLWNLNGKEGAVYSIPNELTNGLDVSVNYLYHTDKTSPALASGASIERGKPYFVKAELVGADAGNFVFEDTGTAVSDFVQYEIPQSGAAAFFNNALSFIKKDWLWFAIGGGIFLFLLLLIIILAATRRRRKERAEERKLEKERKAEEKARKEEERRLKEEQREEEKRRREQEREDAKAKAEAERELQKAKAEAELAKMRAEMGMAGAGAMAMQAMAQPQQQMPMQQAMPMQPMQYMQPQYQQPQYPQYPPMPPQPYPQMPQQSYDGGNARINQLEMEVAKLKAESDIRTVGMDERAKTAYFAPMQAGPMIMQSRESVPEHNAKQGMTAEILGEAILTAITKLVENKANAPVQAIPVSVEKSNPVSVAYPPDAVVTTTTTVDTTKAPTAPKPQRITREDDNKYFDIDGFYDTFEEDV